MMDRISICEALSKRNEIDPFLKRMVTGDEKWITYDNIVRNRSWSKRDEVAQTVAKPGLTSRKVLLCICLPNPVEQKSHDVINNKLSRVMKEVAEESMKMAAVEEYSSSPDNL
ncbi:mariner transposase [Trichonephila clavipes]|nr:mariner transposase [Trichonephila clavipes]